jgi:thioredoxin 1
MADFNSIINSGKPVLVDFFAEWCGPCKTMAPILKQVKDKLGDKATIIKVDIDKNAAAAQAYNIRSVPTFVLFRNGSVIWKKSGVMQAEELVQLLSK